MAHLQPITGTDRVIEQRLLYRMKGIGSKPVVWLSIPLRLVSYGSAPTEIVPTA